MTRFWITWTVNRIGNFSSFAQRLIKLYSWCLVKKKLVIWGLSLCLRLMWMHTWIGVAGSVGSGGGRTLTYYTDCWLNCTEWKKGKWILYEWYIPSIREAMPIQLTYMWLGRSGTELQKTYILRCLDRFLKKKNFSCSFADNSYK